MKAAAGRESSLRPVAATFTLFGAFWGAWAVSTADIERSLHAGHAAFGALLSVGLLGGAAANAVGGQLSERWGTPPVLRASLATWGTLLAVTAVAGGGVVFAAAMTVSVALAGLVDVVMNIAAVGALAGQPGRLVRLHGLFNAGAAGGAVAAGALLHAGASWRWVWLAAGVVAWILAVVTGRAALGAGEPGESGSMADGIRMLRREGLLVLALAFAVGAMIEGGVSTWGVLYLREQLSSGVLLGTAAAAVGFAVGAVARIVLGPAAGAAGAARGVGIGAGMAAAGLALLAATHEAVLAAGGLVLAAMGISMCWPLLIARASEGRARPALVVGGVSAVGYLGLVLGPALVGGLASAAGLRVGLLMLAAASVFVAVAPSWPLRARAA